MHTHFTSSMEEEHCQPGPRPGLKLNMQKYGSVYCYKEIYYIFLTFCSTDGLREPTIHIFPPPTEELSNNALVGVICLFKDVNHKDIYVEWRKNNVILGEDHYQNTEPILTDDNKTYIMFSRVLVYKSDWMRGAVFACHGGFRNILFKEIKRNGKV